MACGQTERHRRRWEGTRSSSLECSRLSAVLSNPKYTRPHATDLLSRLQEPRRFLQIVTGARQVGKTTLVTQVAEQSGLPYRFASADEPTLRGPEWIATQWDAARLVADDAWPGGALLILDEVQKAAELGGGRQAPVGRGHAELEAAQRGFVGVGTPPARTRSDREPRWPLRGPAPAALELPRDADGVRLVSGAVPVLWRLTRRGAAYTTAGPLAALHP